MRVLPYLRFAALWALWARLTLEALGTFRADRAGRPLLTLEALFALRAFGSDRTRRTLLALKPLFALRPRGTLDALEALLTLGTLGTDESLLTG